MRVLKRGLAHKHNPFLQPSPCTKMYFISRFFKIQILNKPQIRFPESFTSPSRQSFALCLFPPSSQMEEEEVEMENAEEQEEEEEAVEGGCIPFQLQFDRPVPFQVKMAEWNPEKDLLAIITDESKILLHRFNWQRLWTVFPGKCVTSLCWSPDGKAIVVGTEDGFVLLHDVENGKLLRSIKTHDVAVICLNWNESAFPNTDRNFLYEDRTCCFFPPAPRIPRMPGLSDDEETTQNLTSVTSQRFNILCSGDKEGSICFSIFGIFPIGKINIHDILLPGNSLRDENSYRLKNASISKVTLSNDLCRLEVLCFGQLIQSDLSTDLDANPLSFHCLHLNTSIFLNRKNELHQVAQQASNIEDLLQVIRSSLSVMSKQWSDFMNSFGSKFNGLSDLIVQHGLNSSPQDEFLSLLLGARTSQALHQFLVNSLGEAGVKRVTKAVDNAGKEIRTVLTEHFQPALEIIGFRIGELRGLSRWRARFKNIGLDEKLMDNVSESAGMLLVQAERFSRILAIVLFLFQNFLNWVLKCTKVLLSEPIDQLQPANSELVVIFVKFLLQNDPVKQLLEPEQKVNVDMQTMKRLEQLIAFGGFTDLTFLERTLANEFSQLEICLKEAFLMPFITVSGKVICKGLLPLFPVSNPTLYIPSSIYYYKEETDCGSDCSNSLKDYVCFKVPNESLGLNNCIGIIRGFTTNNNNDYSNSSMIQEDSYFDAVLLKLPDEYVCVDVTLYKDDQIIMLLNETISSSENSEKSLMVMMQANDLPFVSLPLNIMPHNLFILQDLRDSIMSLNLEEGKVRDIPHSVSSPLAVSASRGVACVFSSKRHALVYILDEDEDEISEME